VLCLIPQGLVAGAPAEPAKSQPSATDFPLDQEPITPIPEPPLADPRKLALGERLFNDANLSANGTRACSTCHDLRTNGADGRRQDRAIDGAELPFNTSTVFNAALSFRLNWEGNVRTLEEGAALSLESPNTMGSTIARDIKIIGGDPGLTRQFEQIYGHGPDRDSLLDAIATFERSLLTPGGRFDRWLEGDRTALSVEERRGYQLFKTFGCVSCHQGVNVGGNLFERHGIFHALASPNPKLLRVPSLRNVAETAPYFHDGSAATLEIAVRQMGYAQLDRKLTNEQVDAIVAFLRTLTGRYVGKLVEAPAP
jgi:cytochrome c peroxidase